MKLKFFISCIPPKSTSQQKGIMMIGGKPRHFKKKKVAEAENSMIALLSQYQPETSFEGPVSLKVTWTYPWRSAETKKNKTKGSMWSDKRPDCDNLIKMLADCMTRLAFWNDDSQIAKLEFSKQWGDHPGIGIEIENL